MPNGRIMLLMAVAVVSGIPIVAYLWETINQVLALQLDPVRLGISVPVAVLLWMYLRFLAKRIQNLPAADVHE